MILYVVAMAFDSCQRFWKLLAVDKAWVIWTQNTHFDTNDYILMETSELRAVRLMTLLHILMSIQIRMYKLYSITFSKWFKVVHFAASKCTHVWTFLKRVLAYILTVLFQWFWGGNSQNNIISALCLYTYVAFVVLGIVATVNRHHQAVESCYAEWQFRSKLAFISFKRMCLIWFSLNNVVMK